MIRRNNVKSITINGKTFKVGDKVKCITKDKYENPGAGWKEGKEFIIKKIQRIATRKKYTILWPINDDHGVYIEYVKHVISGKEDPIERIKKLLDM